MHPPHAKKAGSAEPAFRQFTREKNETLFRLLLLLLTDADLELLLLGVLKGLVVMPRNYIF